MNESALSIAGKSYELNKNFEKKALLNIITKLQDDLSEIKTFARDQPDDVNNMQAPTKVAEPVVHELATIKKPSQMSYSTNMFPVHDATAISACSFNYNSISNAELKQRLKKNYEEKVQNTVNLYEKKIEEYKKKVKYLEDDREAFAEALETKHMIISNMKSELDELNEHTDAEKEQIKAKYEEELEKLKNEIDITEKCYEDLESIRKYLERSNTNLKNELIETNKECEKKILQIADEYEKEKCKYANEMKQFRKSANIIEMQSEEQIKKLEQNMAIMEQCRENEVTALKLEIDAMKAQQKELEEERAKIENEHKVYDDVMANTTVYYEAKLSNAMNRAANEKESLMEEITAMKSKYEKQLVKIMEEFTGLEQSVQTKQIEYEDTEKTKNILLNELGDLKRDFALSNQKHEDDFNLLKKSHESSISNYENEISGLRTKLLDREKMVDDLDIANKKFEKQYNSLKATIKTIREDAEKDSLKMWEKLKNEKGYYQDELTKLKLEHAAKHKKLEDEIEKIRLENDELNEQCNMLETSKRNEVKKNRDMKLTIKSIEDEHKEEIDKMNSEFEETRNAYETKLDNQNNLIIQHQKTINDYEETNRMLQATNDEQKALIAENYTTYINDVARLKEEMDILKKFHADDLSSFQKQQELKEQMDKEKDERIKKLKQQIAEIKVGQTAEVEEKFEKIERAKKELENTNIILKHRVNDLSEDFKILKDQYETDQERLKTRYEDESAKLKQQIADLTATNDVLEKTITDQERENKLFKKNLEDMCQKQSDDALELEENLCYTKKKYEEKVIKLKQELDTQRRQFEEQLEQSKNEFANDVQEYEVNIRELKSELVSRNELYEELEQSKKELEANWKILQSDDFRKLAFLGSMGQTKYFNENQL